jgi:hypothetical protein
MVAYAECVQGSEHPAHPFADEVARMGARTRHVPQDRPRVAANEALASVARLPAHFTGRAVKFSEKSCHSEERSDEDTIFSCQEKSEIFLLFEQYSGSKRVPCLTRAKITRNILRATAMSATFFGFWWSSNR